MVFTCVLLSFLSSLLEISHLRCSHFVEKQPNGNGDDNVQHFM